MRPSLVSLSQTMAVSVTALLAACMPTDSGRTVSIPAESASEVMMEAAPVVAESAPTADSYAGVARRGVVTAGDIDDALNLGAFSRYLKRMAAQTGLPQLGLGTAVQAHVTGPDGAPASGARYSLRRPGAADPFHEGYVGPDGLIHAFPQAMGAGALGQVDIRIFSNDGRLIGQNAAIAGKRNTILLSEATGWQPDFLDLVLVVDTTGSMGDEIAFLQKELIGITRAAARKAPGLSVRYGLVAYRDQGDDYVVRDYGFTSSAPEMAGWLRGLTADGGGDYPEAAAAALKAGVDMPWRRGKGERLLLHVADAPPHDRDAGAYLRAAKAAAADGVQIFTLGASGVAREAEFLMRQAALVSGGRYLFLTDDSGVGNAHAEPSIPCYRVTKLSRLLTRILMSELTGERFEASGAEVIREVGSYTGGICRN